MFNKKKIIVIFLVSVLLMAFCVSCSKKPPYRSGPNGKCGSGMVWIPGHYSASGNWLPGHCAQK